MLPDDVPSMTNLVCFVIEHESLGLYKKEKIRNTIMKGDSVYIHGEILSQQHDQYTHLQSSIRREVFENSCEGTGSSSTDRSRTRISGPWLIGNVE